MTKPNTIVEHPDWNTAQRTAFERLDAALPVAMSYMSGEIPVLDNTSDTRLVDEVGDLKKAKKLFEVAEKAHVERLKARLGDRDSLKGDIYEAKFKGGGRVILNQGACKAFIEAANEEGIHLNRLLAAIKSGQVEIPENVLLRAEKPGTGPDDPYIPPEANEPDFYTSAAGGRSLYVEPM